jgi:hypothetical protein
MMRFDEAGAWIRRNAHNPALVAQRIAACSAYWQERGETDTEDDPKRFWDD